MPTREFKLELSDDISKHLGTTDEEVENQIYERLIMGLLSDGSIDVIEAAKKLNCDPDDLLTPEQEAALAEGAAQIERGEYISLEDLEKLLDCG